MALFLTGLEKRVRSLVDGYRELNELVDQAPARVSDAASEYAQALGFRPQEPSRSADAIAGYGSRQASPAGGWGRLSRYKRHVQEVVARSGVRIFTGYELSRAFLHSMRLFPAGWFIVIDVE